ncbi:MAG: ABC transporter substrate-binding protein [Elusimicrobiota bacterium]|nr:ABC transporter substrate-binding protein [Elusimicrobiota bacterium]
MTKLAYKKSVILFGLVFLFGITGAIAADNFNPAGWDSNNEFPLIGSERAEKGGTIKFFWRNYPATLRTNGPNANSYTIQEIHRVVYESLIDLHPSTNEYIPELADFWRISEDKRKFSFHINPKARWSDGTRVSAEDVVASWEFRVREDIKDPYSIMMWQDNFEKPIRESKYVVSVKTKKLNWRLFLYFGRMDIYQAEEMRALSGEEYLKNYNWKMQMGSGPYELRPENIKKDYYLAVTKRGNYWAEHERRNIGLNNFDKIMWRIILDRELAFEKLKKGEIDFYYVSRAQRWMKECAFDKIKKGRILKRKIYTEAPESFLGFAFNMRKPPFDNRDTRKAFSLLLNRKKLLDKLFFNEYAYIDSYFPWAGWSGERNPKIRYSPRRAAKLLRRAGWKNRNRDGWLTNGKGEIFEITLEYGSEGWSKIHKVIKEDVEKAGIKMNLKLIDSRTLMKKVNERNFTLHYKLWGAPLFPNPAIRWSSELADEKYNNNIPGFKNKKVDALCEKYDRTFYREEQKKIIKKMDGIIFREYPYALSWYTNFNRILYANKFGHRKTYFSKFGDFRDIKTMWWLDSKKEKVLSDAIETDKSLPTGKVVQKPWQ